MGLLASTQGAPNLFSVRDPAAIGKRWNRQDAKTLSKGKSRYQYSFPRSVSSSAGLARNSRCSGRGLDRAGGQTTLEAEPELRKCRRGASETAFPRGARERGVVGSEDDVVDSAERGNEGLLFSSLSCVASWRFNLFKFGL